MTGVTSAIARFAAATPPERVVAEARACLAETLVAAAHARDHEVVRAIAAAAPPGASTRGPEAATTSFAAMGIAAAAAAALPPTRGTDAVVCAAAYVAAERVGSAARLDSAVAAGRELAARLAAALGARHAARWDVAGSAGRVAAAVAGAIVLGGGVEAALGFAATQAAGLVAGGELLRILGVGKAAADALEAAAIGAAGLVGPPAPLEGRRGLFALVAGGAAADPVIEGLGREWISVADAEPGAAPTYLDSLRAILAGPPPGRPR